VYCTYIFEVIRLHLLLVWWYWIHCQDIYVPPSTPSLSLAVFSRHFHFKVLVYTSLEGLFGSDAAYNWWFTLCYINRECHSMIYLNLALWCQFLRGHILLLLLTLGRLVFWGNCNVLDLWAFSSLSWERFSPVQLNRDQNIQNILDWSVSLIYWINPHK